MLREVKIFVGINLDAGGIKKALAPFSSDGEDSCLLYEVAHALLTDHKDDRAEILRVVIGDVIIHPNFPSQVEINFESSWSIYYGCRDMNGGGVKEECENTTYTDNGYLIFLVPRPRRESNPC